MTLQKQNNYKVNKYRMINHLVMKRYLARYLKLQKRTPYTLSIVINE